MERSSYALGACLQIAADQWHTIVLFVDLYYMTYPIKIPNDILGNQSICIL